MSLLTFLDNFIMKVEPEWKALHRVADKRLKEVAAIYENAFRVIKDNIDVDKLSQEPIAMMDDRIDWRIFEDACDKVYEALGLVLVEAGTEAAKYLSNKTFQLKSQSVNKAKPISMPTLEAGDGGIKLTGAFNIRNPKAAQWATQHVGQNIRQITDTSKKGIQVIITDALNHGGHPYETARKIRDHIGLTEKQMKGILKYQAKLDEEGRPRAQVDRMVDAEIRRKIRARANMIARTETQAAACAGQQLHWEDQMAKGYLSNEYFQKEWIVTPDDRLCPVCAAMEGKRAPIDGTFDGGYKTPPLHPMCRCSFGLVEIEGKTLEDYAATAEGKDWTAIDQLAGIIPVPVLPVVKGNWGDVEYIDSLKATDERLAKLQQQYPLKDIPLHSHGDWLLEKQAAWDKSLERNLVDYMRENPGVKEKVARKKVISSMTERPTKYDMWTAGEFFNTRIGINPQSLSADSTLDEAIQLREQKLALYAKRTAEGKKPRYLAGLAYGNEATMIHEYGHAIMNDKQLWSDSAFHEYFASLSHDEIAADVSEYAATNIDEFFAECFTEIHMPNPRPIAVKAMQLVGIEVPKGV